MPMVPNHEIDDGKRNSRITRKVNLLGAYIDSQQHLRGHCGRDNVNWNGGCTGDENVVPA